MEFDNFASLFDAANPTKESERALVAGYYLQEVEKRENFGSQDVNTMLKKLGRGVGNIARAFDDLQATTPRLIHRLGKKGKTQQARKVFEVTGEGFKKVRSMIAQAQNAGG